MTEGDETDREQIERELMDRGWQLLLAQQGVEPKCMSYADIGVELDISPTAVMRIEAKALLKVLRKSTARQIEGIHELLKDREEIQTLPDEVLVELDELEYYYFGYNQGVGGEV